MAIAQIVFKWDDVNDELRGYCDGDPTYMFFQAFWDDANDRLDMDCFGTEYAVKWDDGENQLEARNLFDFCCECDNCCDSNKIDYVEYTLAGSGGDDGTANLRHDGGAGCNYYCDDDDPGFECDTEGGFTVANVQFCLDVNGGDHCSSAIIAEIYFAEVCDHDCKDQADVPDEMFGGVTHTWDVKWK